MARNVPPTPQKAQVPAPASSYAGYRPNFVQMIFHVGRTSRLAGALLRDPHISIFRKIFFLGAIAGLILALALPESVGELASTILPFIGPAIGLSGDIAIDWVAATVIGFNLLRIFPPEIVGEHYDRLFRTPAPQIPSRQPPVPRSSHR